MKKFMLLGVACLLAGCISLEKVSEELSTKWVGKSYDEFVIEKGIAKNSHKLSNGMTMYMWEEEGLVNAQGDIATITKAVATAHCTLNVLVDTKNIIQSIKASGNPQICHVK